MASEQEEPAEAAPARRGFRKVLLILPPVAVALLGAGLWFSGILPGLLGKDKEHAQAERAGPPVFLDLPEIIANLNGNPRRPTYVKLRAKLEVKRSEDAAAVQAVMPRVMDLFQTYVREMRPEELRGAAGTYRLREELLARVNLAAAPVKVADVLFTELLVQ